MIENLTILPLRSNSTQLHRVSRLLAFLFHAFISFLYSHNETTNKFISMLILVSAMYILKQVIGVAKEWTPALP